MFCKRCVIFAIVIICFVNINAGNTKKKLGVLLTKVEPCPHPARKMVKDNPASVCSTFRIMSNRSSFIDMNINITRPFGPVFISLRVYQIQKDDTLKEIFKVQDATCRHPLTFQLIKTYNAPVDKNCIVGKAVILVKDLNIDKFSWFLTKAPTSPGKYVYETEYTTDNSCVYCSRLTCELYVKK